LFHLSEGRFFVRRFNRPAVSAITGAQAEQKST
jgi:hypothetical protein